MSSLHTMIVYFIVGKSVRLPIGVNEVLTEYIVAAKDQELQGIFFHFSFQQSSKKNTTYYH